jgi:hypothetical protein
MIQRERFEEYQKHLYLGRTMAFLFGGEMTNVPQMARAEELLELAIFQTAYDPREIRKQMEIANAVAMAEREERLRDARLLAKVASYDEPDENEADAFRAVLSKTRLSGVEDPWS